MPTPDTRHRESADDSAASGSLLKAAHSGLPGLLVVKPAEPALAVRGLSAAYAGPDVFRDINIVLQQGETLRVAGVNAAGKSTLLRCAAGVHQPRTGWIRICDFDIVAQPIEAKRHLGYTDGIVPFTYLTGREHLLLGLRVYRLPRAALTDLLDRFSGWAVVRGIDTEVKRYSHGMRQQLSALLSVLHDPCLLLLDEVTDGFDDDSLSDWQHYLKERSAAGRSLVFVEHRDNIAPVFPDARHLVLRPFDPAVTGGD